VKAFNPAVIKKYLGSGLRRAPFYLLFLPLYALSFLFPRDPRLWVFGALDGRGYTGNTRMLTSYVQQKRSETRALWHALDPEVCSKMRQLALRSFSEHSLKGFWVLLRIRVYFVTHHLLGVKPFVSGGAEGVQHWHGIPLKKIGSDTLKPGLYMRFLLAREPPGALFRRAHTFQKAWILATLEETARTLCSGYQAPRERVWITGYPRSDALFLP